MPKVKLLNSNIFFKLEALETKLENLIKFLQTECHLF